MTHPFSFNTEQLNRLFPFYILINRDLKVIALGKSLSKICDLKNVQQFNHYFNIPKPLTPINSIDDLIISLERLIDMGHDARLGMGVKSRELVVRKFDERIVIEKYLDCLGL